MLMNSLILGVSAYTDREHVYRSHSLKPQCTRCRKTFPDDAQLADHSRSATPCEVRDLEIQGVDGVDLATKERLRSRRSAFMGESEEQIWKDMYLILFPQTDPTAIPSPCKCRQVLLECCCAHSGLLRSLTDQHETTATMKKW